MQHLQQPPAVTPPRWRRWLVEIILFAALLVAFQAWQLRATPNAGAAPDFNGTQIDGSAFDLADYRTAHPGQPVLLYFWADWCPVCRTTAGSVSSIAADWPVMTLATQSGDAAAVRRFMQEKGYQWPTLADADGQILQRYRLPGTPAFVVIAPDGNIRFVSVGYTTEIGLRLRLWWAGR